MPDLQLFADRDPNVHLKMAAIGRQIGGLSGISRMRAGLSAMRDAGFISDVNSPTQVKSALKSLPGPFGDGNPNEELPSFLNFAEGFSNAIGNYSFDPMGLQGGRFAGLGDGDPRDEAGREGCDLFGLIASDTASGSTGANVTATITQTDTEYRRAVLWLWTRGGTVRNITSLTVDSRPFYLGPSASMPADICDVTLEPHPRRQGIYLGNVKKSLSVTAFLDTSATSVHWEVLLDAEVENIDTQRPGGRILARRAFKAFGG